MCLIVSWHVGEDADIDWLDAGSGPVALLHFGDGASLRWLREACRSRGIKVTAVVPAGIAVDRMLTGEVHPERFAAWREAQIEATFYRLDGRSHERTLARIEAILEEGAW